MRIDQPDPDQPDQPDQPGAPRPGPADRGDRGDRGADASPAQQRPEATVSREEQIAEHVRYREVVEAAFQAAADREAWTGAAPRLRVAWEEHKERYPERVRASPHTETDGTWVSGEHRRLDPEQNTEASKAHADLADEADRHILPALRRVEAADPDRRLAGLEHMVKGEDRLKEKLADELFGKDKTVREALSEVPDAVRFTLRYDHERYVCKQLLVQF